MQRMRPARNRDELILGKSGTPGSVPEPPSARPVRDRAQAQGLARPLVSEAEVAQGVGGVEAKAARPPKCPIHRGELWRC